MLAFPVKGERDQTLSNTTYLKKSYNKIKVNIQLRNWTLQKSQMKGECLTTKLTSGKNYFSNTKHFLVIFHGLYALCGIRNTVQGSRFLYCHFSQKHHDEPSLTNYIVHSSPKYRKVFCCHLPPTDPNLLKGTRWNA